MYKRTETLGNIHQKTLSLLSSESEKNSYLEYRKQFEDAASFKKIHKFPIHLDIELDNVCNYACTFCPIGQPENKLNSYYKDIKKLDEIKVFEILDEAKSTNFFISSGSLESIWSGPSKSLLIVKCLSIMLAPNPKDIKEISIPGK